MIKVIYTKATTKDIPFLKEMLYEALYVPEGVAPFPITILEEPSIAKYLKGWGEEEMDIAVLAQIKGHAIGAAWGRQFLSENKGYGFVDSKTPELTIAIKKKYRSMGIGTKLIEELQTIYQSIGVEKISLSVDKRSKAKQWYESLGFKFYEDAGTAITMVKVLNRF